jgi:acylphosphatase
MGLRGYCRNLMDGKVEVVAEGEELELMALEKELARGPRLAVVASVEKYEILDDVACYNSFEIM